MDSSDDEDHSIYQWDRVHRYDDPRPSEGERELVKMRIKWRRIQDEAIKADRVEVKRRRRDFGSAVSGTVA